ncbi:MAG: hypothetical protein IPF53_02910 [Blastocatellia bacterium]|nr:hypothetical protein [Blastocatellia bacterium]
MDPRWSPGEAMTSSTYRPSPGAVLGTCVVLAPTVVLFGWALRSTTGLRHTLLVLIIGLVSVFLIWLLLRLGETIVISDDGIERSTPLLGRGLLRWADVTDIEIADSPAVGRAFKLVSGVTPPIRVGDFVARYDDVLADVLARVPARAVAHAYANGNSRVRDRLEQAISGRAAVDAEFVASVRDALSSCGLESEAAMLEHRIVAWPRRDVIDSASKQGL